ncbi:M28 family peptidase [Gemmatirosa kalamazoonensis]|uniref:M28 family peptidase n=1 Tax=Gemmatirosa kalamazoonensis TaxID=861299 RepID=UPI0011DC8C32|nr:M28 family peptidase [Gemmatirosa kalamazoonensis]
MPRPAGSAAEARAREHCANVLRAAGFDVREVPFSYSSAPGRWGMPTAGALAGVTLVGAARAGTRGHAGLALVTLVTLGALLVLVAPRALGDGVARLPIARRRAVNLVATRGTNAPTLWLVAHVDAKSQPVPMAARVAGVGGSLVAWALAVMLAVAQLLGAASDAAWTPLAIVGVLAALPVIGSVIGAASPGALDNASGVATVLLAVEAPSLGPPLPERIGVLVTSAEEVGLAGARAWGRAPAEGARIVSSSAPTRPVALNVDSVDDEGALRVMRASALPVSLERALDDEAHVRRRRLPPGVLVDAIALADAGFAALTVSKATVRSLSRIHTSRDAVDELRGIGVVEAAALVRRLAARA